MYIITCMMQLADGLNLHGRTGSPGLWGRGEHHAGAAGAGASSWRARCERSGRGERRKTSPLSETDRESFQGLCATNCSEVRLCLGVVFHDWPKVVQIYAVGARNVMILQVDCPTCPLFHPTRGRKKAHTHNWTTCIGPHHLRKGSHRSRGIVRALKQDAQVVPIVVRTSQKQRTHKNTIGINKAVEVQPRVT